MAQLQMHLEPSISFTWLVANVAHEFRWSCLCRLLATQSSFLSVCDPHFLAGRRSFKYLHSPFDAIQRSIPPARQHSTMPGNILWRVFEPQLRSTSSPRAVCKFPVENLFQQPEIIHADHVTCPTQLTSSENDVRLRRSGSGANFIVRDIIASFDTHYRTQ